MDTIQQAALPAVPGGFQSPTVFTPAVREALISLPHKLSGWASAFEACDGGDEWAAVTRVGEYDGVAFVTAEAGGAVHVLDRMSVVAGTASDPDALLTLLSSFLASPRRRG